MTQISLSFVMVAGAVLFARSVANLRANAAPFSTERVVWSRLWLNPGVRQASGGLRYYATLTEQLGGLPGVRAVGLSYFFPSYLNASPAMHLIKRVQSSDGQGELLGMMEVISPHFYETVGLAVQRGRDFSWRDDSESSGVTIVNTTLARQLYPGVDAIGQRITIGRDPARQSLEIIGIVEDAPVGNIHSPHLPVAFRPLGQETDYVRNPVVSLHAAANIDTLADGIRRTVAALGQHYIRSVGSLDGQIDDALLEARLMARFSALVAIASTLLACIGLYGSIAYAATLRAREIAVRVAIGATHASVIRLIAREAALLALAGVAIGIPCALIGGRFVRSVVYGVMWADPTALMVASGVLVAVGLLAGLIPAYRAARIDPVTRLRMD